MRRLLLWLGLTVATLGLTLPTTHGSTLPRFTLTPAPTPTTTTTRFCAPSDAQTCSTAHYIHALVLCPAILLLPVLLGSCTCIIYGGWAKPALPPRVIQNNVLVANPDPETLPEEALSKWKAAHPTRAAGEATRAGLGVAMVAVVVFGTLALLASADANAGEGGGASAARNGAEGVGGDVGAFVAVYTTALLLSPINASVAAGGATDVALEAARGGAQTVAAALRSVAASSNAWDYARALLLIIVAAVAFAAVSLALCAATLRSRRTAYAAAVTAATALAATTALLLFHIVATAAVDDLCHEFDASLANTTSLSAPTPSPSTSPPSTASTTTTSSSTTTFTPSLLSPSTTLLANLVSCPSAFAAVPPLVANTTAAARSAVCASGLALCTAAAEVAAASAAVSFLPAPCTTTPAVGVNCAVDAATGAPLAAALSLDTAVADYAVGNSSTCAGAPPAETTTPPEALCVRSTATLLTCAIGACVSPRSRSQAASLAALLTTRATVARSLAPAAHALTQCAFLPPLLAAAHPHICSTTAPALALTSFHLAALAASLAALALLALLGGRTLVPLSHTRAHATAAAHRPSSASPDASSNASSSSVLASSSSNAALPSSSASSASSASSRPLTSIAPIANPALPHAISTVAAALTHDLYSYSYYSASSAASSASAASATPPPSPPNSAHDPLLHARLSTAAAQRRAPSFAAAPLERGSPSTASVFAAPSSITPSASASALPAIASPNAPLARSLSTAVHSPLGTHVPLAAGSVVVLADDEGVHV